MYKIMLHKFSVAGLHWPHEMPKKPKGMVHNLELVVKAYNLELVVKAYNLELSPQYIQLRASPQIVQLGA